MSDLTRRGFVKNSAGAAAGVTVIGVLAAERAEARTEASQSEPLVAYVSDPRKGEIAVMSGDREVKVRDRELAARIARVAR
ncbi:MAG TPA: twin-arginine translocation signal domain-containing protein [Solirubrobacteraceae bacterium]|nr:twin-arginine translocation signal domain-containing protein [Solirubrobacteraceae bacterium]